MLRHEQLQNGVTKKFETLIVEVMPLGFVAETRMRQRFREQKRIPKFVADAFLEWIHYAAILRGGGQLSRPRA
jgi:hypothetical protein